MPHDSSLPTVTTALLDVEPVVSGFAACPLCHTTSQSMTTDALAAGADWQCVRCGQRWSAARMATVAAYAAWVLEREERGRMTIQP
jgi:transcription elongation factor Elf1